MPDKEFIDVKLNVETNIDEILPEFSEVLVKIITNYQVVLGKVVKNDFKLKGINKDDIEKIVYLINTMLPDPDK